MIELSIEETNKLRLELGLKPLRGVTSSSSSLSGNTAATTNPPPPLEQNHNSTSKKPDEINLSIEETNNLRSKLGLPPLKISSSQNNSGKKASEAIHAPALNTRKKDEIQKRIEEAKLKREVEAGLAKMHKDVLSQSEKGEGGNMISWAQKMRHGNNITADTTGATKTVKMEKKVKTKSRHDGNKSSTSSANTGYTNNDFNYQNVTVTHSKNDFEAGTTTILTLADKNILGDDDDENNDHDNQLENVNMIENATVANNLKQKRILEMGLGHAGGYAGYDDDEFEEMGGIGVFTTNNGGSGGNYNNNSEDAKKKRKGFKLTDTISNSNQVENNKVEKSELFNSFQGKSVSLISSKQNSIQSDYMTYDEEEAFSNSIVSRADLEKKLKKKEKKMLKKLKKKEKAEKKDKEYTEESSKDKKDGQTLLDDLESNASAMQNGKNNQRSRKRRRVTDDDDSDEDTYNLSSKVGVDDKNQLQSGDNDLDIQTVRKEKFDSIMQKGNIRTENIFKDHQSHSVPQEEMERDDDEFLSVALSKARRLRRLKELNAKENKIKSNTAVRGADAVVKSISSMRNSMNIEKESKKNSTITFELDATKEFTRMLRSQKTEDIDESMKDSQRHANIDMTSSNDLNETVPLAQHVTDEPESDPLESLEALADQVEEDQPDSLGGFGDTASTLPLGRGMASCLSMLKHTGEITGKNAGKEELRGRAKDERNYEDYEKLNLKEVVKLDTSRRSVHGKDLEFANREVKLEYRDKHGRLLTRKEAWRDLSYQFHGYGSSKKNEERRLRQIERERAEASRASKHGTSGTFGALKATQSATGKAFVLHKT